MVIDWYIKEPSTYHAATTQYAIKQMSPRMVGLESCLKASSLTFTPISGRRVLWIVNRNPEGGGTYWLTLSKVKCDKKADKVKIYDSSLSSISFSVQQSICNIMRNGTPTKQNGKIRLLFSDVAYQQNPNDWNKECICRISIFVLLWAPRVSIDMKSHNDNNRVGTPRPLCKYYMCREKWARTMFSMAITPDPMLYSVSAFTLYLIILFSICHYASSFNISLSRIINLITGFSIQSFGFILCDVH